MENVLLECQQLLLTAFCLFVIFFYFFLHDRLNIAMKNLPFKFGHWHMIWCTYCISREQKKSHIATFGGDHSLPFVG